MSSCCKCILEALRGMSAARAERVLGGTFKATLRLWRRNRNVLCLKPTVPTV